MPLCYFVPGSMGTTLNKDSLIPTTVWVDYGQLGTLGSGPFRLALDGVNPAPPDGLALLPGTVLPSYYATCLNTLALSLKASGYTVVAFAYDWRKSLGPVAELLAEDVRQNVTSGTPCTLIGHSQGGLVVRGAWASLVKSGQADLVRRVILLGAPNQGTYAPVGLFSVYHEALNQLYFLQAVVGLPNRISGFPVAYPLYTPAEIAAIATTWPALYDLMPSYDGISPVSDPYRGYLYQADKWKGVVHPLQKWMDYSISHFQSVLRDPDSVPPRWILTTVAGTGTPTLDQLSFPDILGSRYALGTTDQGDGTVTVASALMEESTQIVGPWRHPDIPTLLAVSGELASLVLEVRDPIQPAPNLESVAGPITPLLAGPPIPGVLADNSGKFACRESPCSC